MDQMDRERQGMNIYTSHEYEVSGPTPDGEVELYSVGWVRFSEADLQDMLAMLPAGKNICEKCAEKETTCT